MNPMFSRREILSRCSNGFGMMALAALMGDKSYAGIATDQKARAPKFKARAKNVFKRGPHAQRQRGIHLSVS